jgi:hypothetical protein
VGRAGLQQLLDRSYEGAGVHMRRIHTPERRLTAAQVAERLTGMRREELAVTVHGRAVPVDVHGEEGAELRRTLLDIYLPRYGEEWLRVLEGGVYARIEAERMFTFHMPAPA